MPAAGSLRRRPSPSSSAEVPGTELFLSVAGEAISNPAAMSLDEVARQPFRDLYDPEIALFRDGMAHPRWARAPGYSSVFLPGRRPGGAAW